MAKGVCVALGEERATVFPDTESDCWSGSDAPGLQPPLSPQGVVCFFGKRRLCTNVMAKSSAPLMYRSTLSAATSSLSAEALLIRSQKFGQSGRVFGEHSEKGVVCCPFLSRSIAMVLPNDNDDMSLSCLHHEGPCTPVACVLLTAVRQFPPHFPQYLLTSHF